MSENQEVRKDNSISKKCSSVAGDSGTGHKLVKASDIVLLVVVLLVAVSGVIYIMLTREPGKKVEISVDGKVIEEFELSKDHEYQMVSDDGNNLIVIKAGMVDIVAADCPDKVCVDHVPIDNAGETIICLPHKLVVEIVE